MARRRVLLPMGACTVRRQFVSWFLGQNVEMRHMRQPNILALAGLFGIASLVACSSSSDHNPSELLSTLKASASSAVANGVDTTTLTIVANNAGGSILPGVQVSLVVTGGTGNLLSAAEGATAANGIFTAALSSTSAGIKTINATLGAGASAVTISTTVSFTANAPSPVNSSITVTPAGLVADGVAVANIKVSVLDSERAPVVGQAVVLTATGAGNTFTPPTGTTNADGTFGAQLVSTGAGLKTVTATVGDVTLTTTVTFVAGAPATGSTTFTTATRSLIADGNQSIPISISVADTNGNPVNGLAVALSSDATGDLFAPASGATGPDGLFASSFSTTSSGAKKLTATIGTGSTKYVVTAMVTATAGTFSAVHSSITAMPPIAVADGLSAMTVTVQGSDAHGNPLVGEPVALTAQGDASTWTQSGGMLDANGQYTTTLYSTLAQTEQISAAFGASTADVVTAAVTFVAGAKSKLVFAMQPSSAVSGSAISPNISVTLEDAHGNIISSDSSSVVTLAIQDNPGNGNLSGIATAVANSGVATFGALSMNKAGTGYTLSASAPGYATSTSNPFNISAGAKSNAAFTVEPSALVAGSTIAPALAVSLEDSAGNVITGDSSTIVTVSIGNNPNGGTLSGSATARANAGVATFSGLSINKSGNGVTLVAAASGYASATSNPFNISPGAKSGAAFTVQPGTTVAGATAAPVAVSLLDANGNVISGDSTTLVTLSIGTNPATGTLAGTLTATANSGVATFSSLSINKSGNGYTLVAAAPGYSSVTSSAFNITPGAKSAVTFTTQPSSTTAGAAFSPAVVVALEDTNGNIITSDSSTLVTLQIGTNQNGAALAGTTAVTANNGVATFPGVSINKTGTGYTLSAAASGYTGIASSSFNITPGAKSGAAFIAQPSNTASGSTLTSVTVALEDASGNVITSDSTTVVSLSIGTNPAGGSLFGTTTAKASSGVATFSTLTIDKSGVGYTLTAAASGYGVATSNAFNIAPGAKSNAVFVAQPSTTAAGASISPSVTVALEDANGNVIASDSVTVVTISIGTNPNSGTLSGTATATATNGVATFSNLGINKSGNGYTLTAVAAGYGNGTSSGFNITPGAKSSTVFAVQPAATTAGASISAVVVALVDANGNVITGDSTTGIVIAIGTNPGGGTLAGTLSVTAHNGIGTFSGLNIDKSGNGYTLSATAAGYAVTTSSPFNIVPGAKSGMAFTVQPTSAASTASLGTMTVALEDANGNLISSDSTTVVTLAIGANPNSGTLSGTTTVTATNGLASFSGLSIDKSGVGYTLSATASGYANSTSSPFNITPGAKSNAVFTAQPATSAAGVAISPPVIVALEDANGNIISTDSTTIVTLAISSNPNSGTLSGTTSIGAINGVATFGTLSINKSGNGYAIAATATGYAGANSTAFNITEGAKSAESFTVQPSSSVAGAAISPITVALMDAYGNMITDDSTTAVTLSIGANPNGGTLSGTTTVTASSGLATFSGLSINKSGSGYTLTTSATGYGNATSSAFNITPGAKSNAVFTVQPAAATAGAALPSLSVSLEDSNGNVIVSDSTTVVTLDIGTNPNGGTLSGTATAQASGGVATFSSVSINKTGIGYTLTASASGYSSATSNGFNITPGSKSTAVFSLQPANGTAGAALASVTVALEDVNGNIITGDSATTVTVSIGTNPNHGTLFGTATVTASGGLATFSGLSIDKSGVGYTLAAIASGYTAAASTGFNIIPGAKSVAVFTGSPASAIAGSSITPVTVSLEDANGNVITGDSTTSVTIGIGTNPNSGTLSGTATVTANSGVATFASLSINKAGVGYTLSAAASGYSNGTTGLFNVTPGAKSVAVFTTQPSAAAVGVAISPSVVVALEDAYGNIITSDSTSTITIGIGNNASAGSLSGATTATATAGVATFSNLSMNQVGTGYTLTAAAPGYTTGPSSAFNINGVPSISGFSPAAISVVGGSLAINGTNFDPANATVTIGGASVSIVSVSATRIVVTVPPAQAAAPQTVVVTSQSNASAGASLPFVLKFTISVDGDLSDWPSAALVGSDSVSSSWSSTNTLTSLYMGYDANYLYIGIQGVTEASNAIVGYLSIGNLAWGSGNIATTLNEHNNHSNGQDALGDEMSSAFNVTASGFLAQYGFGLFGTANGLTNGISPGLGARRFLNTTNFDWVTSSVEQANNSGTNGIEFAIPWQTVGTGSDLFVPFPTGGASPLSISAFVRIVSCSGGCFPNQSLPLDPNATSNNSTVAETITKVSTIQIY